MILTSERAAHRPAIGSTALVKTNGIGTARLDKAARPSQSGEVARLDNLTGISCRKTNRPNPIFLACLKPI